MPQLEKVFKEAVVRHFPDCTYSRDPDLNAKAESTEDGSDSSSTSSSEKSDDDSENESENSEEESSQASMSQEDDDEEDHSPRTVFQEHSYFTAKHG